VLLTPPLNGIPLGFVAARPTREMISTLAIAVHTLIALASGLRGERGSAHCLAGSVATFSGWRR
jgi:hypothetical protein